VFDISGATIGIGFVTGRVLLIRFSAAVSPSGDRIGHVRI